MGDPRNYTWSGLNQTILTFSLKGGTQEGSPSPELPVITSRANCVSPGLFRALGEGRTGDTRQEESKRAPFAKPKPQGCSTPLGISVERLPHPPAV